MQSAFQHLLAHVDRIVDPNSAQAAILRVLAEAWVSETTEADPVVLAMALSLYVEDVGTTYEHVRRFYLLPPRDENDVQMKDVKIEAQTPHGEVTIRGPGPDKDALQSIPAMKALPQYRGCTSEFDIKHERLDHVGGCYVYCALTRVVGFDTLDFATVVQRTRKWLDILQRTPVEERADKIHWAYDGEAPGKKYRAGRVFVAEFSMSKLHTVDGKKVRNTEIFHIPIATYYFRTTIEKEDLVQGAAILKMQAKLVEAMGKVTPFPKNTGNWLEFDSMEMELLLPQALMDYA